MSELQALNATVYLLRDQVALLKTTVSDLSVTSPPIEALKDDVNNFWLIFGGVLVFFMQSGFSLLEAGSVREKNVNNILYKNLMDAAIGALAFWWFGFGFAYGLDGDENGFIGTSNFALWRETDNTSPHQGYVNFFFQWAFAATAATIVSGSVAERTKIPAYFCYSFFLTSFVYPVVVHWVWDAEGWLNLKMIDFAGSGVVHMVGGFSALMGAIVVGPRLGRFTKEQDSKAEVLVKFASHNVYEIRGHSSLLAALGVFLLWVGWYGFNCASTLAISDGASLLAAKVSVTTTIAAASGAVTVTIFQKVCHGYWDLLGSLNGVLAGLVGITAGCAVVEPWAAFVIGIIAGFVLLGLSHLLKRLKIDDPLDAFPVHGGCGLWGVIAAGLFCTTKNAEFAGYDRASQIQSGEQIGMQFLGGLCIAVWTVATSGIMFLTIKYTIGMKVDEKDERTGLDEAEHGGVAYHHDVELASVTTSQA